MNCQKIQELFKLYLTGDIDNNQFAEVKEHTEDCGECRDELEKMDIFKSSVKSAYSADMAESGAKDSIINRLPDRKQANRLTVLKYAAAAILLFIFGLFSGLFMADMEMGVSGQGKPVGVQISSKEGTILIKRAGSDEYAAFDPDAEIYVGDTLQTFARSGCVFQMQDESTIEIKANTSLTFRSFDEKIDLYLDAGQAHADLNSPHKPFFVTTPYGKAEALGTEFTVTVD